jgi:hypothetical protein
MLMMTMAWIIAWTASEAGSVQSCAHLIAARTLLCRGACGIYEAMWVSNDAEHLYGPLTAKSCD